MWVKKDEQESSDRNGAGNRPSSSRSDTEIIDASSRQSRREMFETSKTAEREVTKSKSMSLKSQLKSPFKFLGKTYCGGCKVVHQESCKILLAQNIFGGRKLKCFL